VLPDAPDIIGDRDRVFEGFCLKLFFFGKVVLPGLKEFNAAIIYRSSDNLNQKSQSLATFKFLVIINMSRMLTPAGQLPRMRANCRQKAQDEHSPKSSLNVFSKPLQISRINILIISFCFLLLFLLHKYSFLLL